MTITIISTFVAATCHALRVFFFKGIIVILTSLPTKCEAIVSVLQSTESLSQETTKLNVSQWFLLCSFIIESIGIADS